MLQPTLSVLLASFKEDEVQQRINLPLNRAHIVLLISSGKKKASVHEANHLGATLDLINKYKPRKVTIVVSDKLQQYSFWNSHLYNKWKKYSADELKITLEQYRQILEDEASARGPSWLNQNEILIQQKLQCTKIAFTGWSAILDLENYQENYSAVLQIYKNDSLFQDITAQCVEEYLSYHAKEIRPQHMDIAREMCTQYVLEECPLILQTTLLSDYTIYHSGPNKLMQEMHKRIRGNAPFPWLSVQYKFYPENHVKLSPSLLQGISMITSKRLQRQKNSKTTCLEVVAA